MKLTDEQREQAKRDIQAQFEEAIWDSPRGLTLEDIRDCFEKAISKFS